MERRLHNVLLKQGIVPSLPVDGHLLEATEEVREER